jgi:hypothetical protein
MKKLLLLLVLAGCSVQPLPPTVYYEVEDTPTTRAIQACSYLARQGRYNEYHVCVETIRN